MIVIGLTGSIGMGKSTATNMLRRMGVPVHDSDAAAHELMLLGGQAVGAISKAFKGVVCAGVVDRSKLGLRVFGDAEALEALETIIHPLVRRDRQRFFASCRRSGVSVVAVDVPLLFEKGIDKECDITVVVSAPYNVQKSRVAKRFGMTGERFDRVLEVQMPDLEKQRLADHVVPSNLGFRVTLNMLARIVRLAKRRAGYRSSGFNRSPL